MKKKIFTTLAGTAFAVGVLAGPALAGQDTLGTPGDKNCNGQTVAFAAQALSAFDVHGIGGLSALTGLSVKDLKAIGRAYCSS